MELRTATIDDLPALYEVCLRTGDAGEDATDRFDDPDLLGSVYVGPYVALDGTVALAAVDDGGVAGYVLAAIDTAAFEAVCEHRWWPALRARYPLLTAGERRDTDAELVAHIHRPPTTPASVTERYPAHLHIDLLPRLQGGGNGRRMIEAMFDALRTAGAAGVHLGVAAANERAVGFYEHLGMRTLHRSERERLMGIRL
jgi:ribosomal protein S18 acetylase RimI-like enzyme